MLAKTARRKIPFLDFVQLKECHSILAAVFFKGASNKWELPVKRVFQNFPWGGVKHEKLFLTGPFF